MPTKNGKTVGRTNFPLYCERHIGDNYVVVTGGGGRAKTGVPNDLIVYRLRPAIDRFEFVPVHRFETETAVMNFDVFPKKRGFLVAAGIDRNCSIMDFVYKMASCDLSDEAQASSTTNELRERKKLTKMTESSSHDNAEKMITIKSVEVKQFTTVDPADAVSLTTSGSGKDTYQKFVLFSSDGNRIFTAGSDGLLKIWSYPDCQLIHSIEAHSPHEVDWLVLSLDNEHIVSAGRDSKCFVWSTQMGSLVQELQWEHWQEQPFRVRCMSYAAIPEKPNESFLLTAHIPSGTSRKKLDCSFVSKWTTGAGYRVAKTITIRQVTVCSFACSDNGYYFSCGSLTGDIFVYTCFGMQQLYHFQTNAGFVTNVMFLPTSVNRRDPSGDFECSVVATLQDQTIRLCNVPADRMWSLWTIVVGAVLIILLLYYSGFIRYLEGLIDTAILGYMGKMGN